MPTSLAVFFGLFALLMAWDLYTLIRNGYASTVSATLLKFSQRFPVVPFAFGILLGHLIWPNLGACLP